MKYCTLITLESSDSGTTPFQSLLWGLGSKWSESTPASGNTNRWLVIPSGLAASLCLVSEKKSCRITALNIYFAEECRNLFFFLLFGPLERQRERQRERERGVKMQTWDSVDPIIILFLFTSLKKRAQKRRICKWLNSTNSVSFTELGHIATQRTRTRAEKRLLWLRLNEVSGAWADFILPMAAGPQVLRIPTMWTILANHRCKRLQVTTGTIPPENPMRFPEQSCKLLSFLSALVCMGAFILLRRK